jgi:hypothetical protein
LLGESAALAPVGDFHSGVREINSTLVRPPAIDKAGKVGQTSATRLTEAKNNH